MNLTYGSRGEEVRKLQTALNNAGYGLSVDGIFGANTQAAVRDYQSKNGLAVDGIAGTQTQGKLYGTGSGDATEPEAPKTPQSYYQPSADVESFKANLQAAIAGKPNAYENQYKQQLDELYDSITGRDKFSYDAEGDALYQQYKDQYQNLGKTAMMDTMGKAAALTGGYGSTYGQAVGQQMYDAYLRELTGKIPELEQRAYERYRQEGDDLTQRYAMLLNKEETDYGRHRDAVSDWGDDVALQYQLYADARDTEREELADSRKYAYDTAMGMIGAGLMPTDQMLADAGLDKKDAQNLVNAYLAQMTPVYSGGGSGGGGSSRTSGDGGDAELFAPTSKRYNTLLSLVNDSSARYSATDKEKIVNAYAASGEITAAEKKELNRQIEEQLDMKLQAYA